MNRKGKFSLLVILSLVLMMVFGMSTLASQADDNSLSALGITTEGVTVTPEFAYDKWEVDVTVPAGTTELTLDPVPSSSSASIASITGTTLNEDGTGTVLITVQAASGSQFTYTLHVTTEGAAPAITDEQAAQQPLTEIETEIKSETEAAAQSEAPTEPQTEDTTYVKVDKNTIAEAEKTITTLQGEISNYRNTVTLYSRIMYGLIALAVILLFIVINQILRKKDLKDELKEYRSLGYTTGSGAKKPVNQNGNNQNGPMSGNGAGAPRMPQGNPQAQAGRAPQGNMKATRAPQVRPQYYEPQSGLDVMPQKSKGRQKQMPQYEQNQQNAQAPVQQAPQKAPAQQPQQKAPVQQQKAPAQPEKKSADVQVDMIDL